MGLRRSPHLAAVVVDMATLAVADRPVAVATAAASREAGDHGPPHMRATVLQKKQRNKRREEDKEGRKEEEEENCLFLFWAAGNKSKNMPQSQKIRQ